MKVFELQYFPPLTFFTALNKETYAYLDIYEIYRKMSFRNRCLIAGAEGIISLSVPLVNGRNQQLEMKKVLTAGHDQWQLRHWKSIQSAYNRSPFFEYYQDELKGLYQESFSSLTEWNLACLKWAIKKLGWPVEIRFTDTAIPYQAEGIEDQRNQILPKNYSVWNPVKYHQVFEERTGFFPNLSVLDILFNKGNEAGELLRDAGSGK